LFHRHYILLVDDDPAQAEMYRLGLEGEGFKVTILADALTLNDFVLREHPDAIVLDWELPGVRGDEALERLRRTETGDAVPVLMLSNFPGTTKGAIDRVFQFGAIAWLEKVNTTPARLAASLREALSGVDTPKA
jgi:DNA-binding response OmpR family regulator